MIHVDVDFESEKAHVEVNEPLNVIIADICTVLREACEDGDIEPEWLIDILKNTFLEGMKKAKAEEGETESEHDEYEIEELKKKLKAMMGRVLREEMEDGIKDERSKEALPGTNRRYRRVRPH